MDHIAVKEYVLVYFHTLTSEYNHLDSDFLKKLYDVVDVKLVIFCKLWRGKELLSFQIEANITVYLWKCISCTKIFIIHSSDILIVVGAP